MDSESSDQDVSASIADILSRIAGVDPSLVKDEARLIEDIGLDSLGFYEILIEADESLGIRIPEEDLLTFRTVGDIAQYLKSAQQSPISARHHNSTHESA
jgi:acyl carrier protein